MTYFSKDFNQFFIELASNNNKDWFDLNRKRYHSSVKEPFQAFVQAVITELSAFNPALKEVEPKDCIFRINRDIRFSKDKTPYKLNLSAVVGTNGKKDLTSDSIYFELGPEHVRFYSGIYETSKEQLYAIRARISQEPKVFRELYSDPKFKQLFGEIRGEKNKIVPKEFKEAADLESLLFNKQFYFFTEHNSSLVTSDELMKNLKEAYQISRPVQSFLSKAIHN